LRHYFAVIDMDEIIVATPISDAPQLSDLIADLGCLPVAVSVWPESVSLPAKWIVTKGSRLGAVHLLPVGGAPLSGWAWVANDVRDRSIAAMLLVIALAAPAGWHHDCSSAHPKDRLNAPCESADEFVLAQRFDLSAALTIRSTERPNK
jgi:uncharacterized protein YbdZ (MbtH family)